MEAVVKQRLIDAQMAYIDGKAPGIVDGAIADAINSLATTFDAPDYGRVSLRQVRFFRSNMRWRCRYSYNPIRPGRTT